MSTQQLDLFERGFQREVNNAIFHSGEAGAGYVRGSATSKAAAQKIAPKVSRLEGYVLDILARASDAGMTDEEIDREASSVAFAPYVTFPTLRPRRIGLAKPKIGKPTIYEVAPIIRPALVEDSGKTRPTQFGNRATVWKLSEEGRRVTEDRANGERS